MSDNQIPEEHMNDPKYGYVVNGMFLLSKWIRENTPQQDHKYQVGDVVILTFECEVIAQHRDCDGSPLYELSTVGGGWPGNLLCLADDPNEQEGVDRE